MAPYEFTQEDYRKFTEDIISANGDQATITTVLADMQDTFTDNIALVETKKKEAEDASKENERLKKANMDLFLRVGAQASGGQEQPKEEQEKLTVDGYMKSYFDKLK